MGVLDGISPMVSLATKTLKEIQLSLSVKYASKLDHRTRLLVLVLAALIRYRVVPLIQ